MVMRAIAGVWLALLLAGCGPSSPIRGQLNGAWVGENAEGVPITLVLDFDANTVTIEGSNEEPVRFEVVNDSNKTVNLKFADGSTGAVSKTNGHIIVSTAYTGALTLHRPP